MTPPAKPLRDAAQQVGGVSTPMKRRVERVDRSRGLLFRLLIKG